MKILFLQFPLEPAWGGAETHTKLLISGLKDLGHEIFLLTSNRALFEKTKEHTTRSKMIFLGWEPTSPYSLLLSPFTFIWAIFVLLANLLIIRPRVLVCLSLTDKLAGTFLAFCLQIPVIWIEHTRVGRWLTASPLKFPYRLLARVATLVAPSYFLRNQLLQVGVPIDRITVIYPGINMLPVTLPLREVARQSGLVVGYLGRLTDEKGVQILLHALALSGNAAIIAGIGPEEQRLKNLTKELGLGKQVKFLGSVVDKQHFFSYIDCLVVPSIKAETFGLVIIEAMAAGVPVVASRIGAIPEIIEDKKTGVLFKPGNEQELKEKIVLLSADFGLRKVLCQAGHRIVAIRFDSVRMVSDYQKLLKRITI